jgi:hypothetical protein
MCDTQRNYANADSRRVFNKSRSQLALSRNCVSISVHFTPTSDVPCTLANALQTGVKQRQIFESQLVSQLIFPLDVRVEFVQ